MASIDDMCWNCSQDLFRDVDLDSLYLRQVRTIGAERWNRYPYMVLFHTGKITLGIDLGEPGRESRWSSHSGSEKAVANMSVICGPSAEDPPD